jgi:hypothetical protein
MDHSHVDRLAVAVAAQLQRRHARWCYLGEEGPVMLALWICLPVAVVGLVVVVVWRIRRAAKLLDRILREERAGVRDLVRRPCP